MKYLLTLLAFALLGCTAQSKPATKGENTTSSATKERYQYTDKNRRRNDPFDGGYLDCDADEIDPCRMITVSVQEVRAALAMILEDTS